MTRFVPVTVLVLLLAASGVASAQATGGSLPSGATVVFEKRRIFDPSKKENPFVEPQAGSTDLLHYFNLAHCNCAQRNASATNQGTTDHIGNFEYLVHETRPSGASVSGGINIDLWVGSSCSDATVEQRGLNCMKVSSIANVDANQPYGGDLEFNLYQVVNGKLHSGDPCLPDNNVSAPIYAFIRANSMTATDDYDYKTSVTAGTLSSDNGMVSGVDTAPPPLPADPEARPSENEIDISWKPATGTTTDIAYYQALCANVDDSPVYASRTDAPQYVTTQSVCPGSNTAVPAAEVPSKTPLDNGEEPVDPPTGDLAALDARYICGQANAGTASLLQIKHLDNGTPYKVILVAVDLHGNFSATYFDHTITPQPATDFWEDLHDRGSKTEGGLCLLAETYGDDSALTRTLRAFRDDTLGRSRFGRWLSDAYYATLGKLGVYVHGSIALRMVAAILLAPLVAFALLWHWLGLPGALGLIAAAWWYRRRRRASPGRGLRWSWLRLPAFAGAAVILLGAGQVHAGGNQPYWEDSDPTDQSRNEQAAPGDPNLVKWHAGIRIGPYVPDIDNQLGVHPGPYEQAFGGYRILPMLDVDRILWTGFGQVGVGASIGYMQKTARAFVMGSDPMQTDRPRAPSATNAFRMIPFALTATYRFTMLDDNYGVPLVPYVRAGLSYYVWWVTAPNGGFARVCNDGKDTSNEPGCSTNKALGGSLGVQGSIGLAIRAERIDASAAQSMRQSGIQHAGIYGELSLAKVDGFGSDKKLSVGDRTWFAGVDFEF